jgi:hypothetical protein
MIMRDSNSGPLGFKSAMVPLEPLKYVKICVICDTHTSLVFWLKLNRKSLKIYDFLSDFIYSDYYNCLTFCIEIF